MMMMHKPAADVVAVLLLLMMMMTTPTPTTAAAACCSSGTHVGEVKNALTCRQLGREMSPCLPFLTDLAVSPSKRCCDGVRVVRGMLVDTASRRQACKCMKEGAVQVPLIRDSAIRALPRLCGVEFPFKLSLAMECSRIPSLSGGV